MGDDLESYMGSAPSGAAAKADAARVHGAMAQLPDDQRQILELGYFAGLSCSEMAEHLQIPIGTVKSRLHAAMKKLRAAFAEEAAK